MTHPKLTFMQYLDSKQKLREAVSKVPQRTATYDVRKYCKLLVGESKEEKRIIALKPNHKVTIEWLYENVDNPTIISISFEGVRGLEADQQHETFWDGEKLQKWLNRNAREIV